MTRMISVNIAFWTWVLLFLTGCAGIGPRTITRDRFDYNTAISDSWKKQVLLNMVKIRYVDAPVFLDVASVINQYAIEGQLELASSGLTQA